MKLIDVRCPYGHWDLESGKWRPNPYLALTEQQQREHNERIGVMPRKPIRKPKPKK